jgi:hypothetical protein
VPANFKATRGFFAPAGACIDAVRASTWFGPNEGPRDVDRSSRGQAWLHRMLPRLAGRGKVRRGAAMHRGVAPSRAARAGRSIVPFLPGVAMPLSLQVLQLVLQSISSLAIAGGLLYSAVQFRHYRRAAHVANYTKLVELQMGLRRMRVDDPSLAYVYSHDVRELADEREIREYFFNLMQVSVFEIVWFSHRQGQLPDDYFRSWVKRMTDIAAEPSFQKMMSTRAMKILHDDFQQYLDDLVAARAARTG